MFHATRDRTARFVWVYSRPRCFASHRAETDLGIPRISRMTRRSMGDSISAIASALNPTLWHSRPRRHPSAGRYDTRVRRPCQNGSRSTRLSVLPDPVRGSSGAKETERGSL